MSSIVVRIPALDPPWPDDAVIMVVTSRAAPGWRSLAHEAAVAAQPGGHSFPLGGKPAGRDAEDSRAAFLYRHMDRVAGYLCLASKVVTGYRDPSSGYRPVTDTERVIRPCVMVIWVDVQLRRHGVARQLVAAAARYANVTPAGLAWSEPFTDSGYLLAQSITSDGLWIADYV